MYSSYPKIMTHMIPGMEDIKVSSLMVIDRSEWDIYILRDLFHENDVQQILKIPISHSREENAWVWLDEANGAYYVKSAYRRLYQIHYGDSNPGNNFNWLKIWRLSVPPKVKNLSREPVKIVFLHLIIYEESMSRFTLFVQFVSVL